VLLGNLMEMCWAWTPVSSVWLAHIFTFKPSKYLQPLWQLIAFDPVHCREIALLTHAFLKTASSLEGL
jgi:hypothetical protein